ncbi:MAG: hypothetical protein LBL41_03210 [Bifidobacteriaceae bacterium]|jgi:hypothetical protein|nr:hypothetical protein [Bifidobacteriaceae bacterium]
MITLKKKLTGALMAFALVTSVLVGGVGAPEARGININCTYNDNFWYSYGDFRYGVSSIICSSGKVRAGIYRWSSGATNATKNYTYGLCKSAGESIAGLSPGQIMISYGPNGCS